MSSEQVYSCAKGVSAFSPNIELGDGASSEAESHFHSVFQLS